eukprot:6818156-Prymnesium_polylepis.1
MKPAFGTIQSVSDDGNYIIRLEDGTQAKGVPQRFVHPVHPHTGSKRKPYMPNMVIQQLRAAGRGRVTLEFE